MSNVLEINVDNFEAEVLNSDVPVLVDFWAPWCGPCKMLGPVVEELAADFEGKAKVAKINVDNNQELAAKFSVRGIPTVMVFKGGSSVESFVGVKSKDDLAEALNKAM
ncbi:MAG: thioredoxin 1 [Candidatus Krumholzibacteriia bacterium]|jgi:thioredoxin 1